MAIRVFLVDDHQVVREGVRHLLENAGDIEIVGEAGTAQDALEGVAASEPDVVLLDVRLPDGSGIDVCREIRSSQPHVRSMILTSYADDEALAMAIMAGAAGYALKQINGSDLVSSIRTVASGGTLIDATTTRRVLSELRARRADAAEIDRLTAREREILELIAEGKTNREIGAELFLAEKTVKNYVSNLLAKLGMGRRSEAAAYAARLQERRTGAERLDG